MNTPYVKEYDENGELLNPIKGKYVSHYPNRQQRSLKNKDNRFHNNSKSYPLVVHKNMAYRKVKQVAFDEDGNRKIIEHYLPKQYKK